MLLTVLQVGFDRPGSMSNTVIGGLVDRRQGARHRFEIGNPDNNVQFRANTLVIDNVEVGTITSQGPGYLIVWVWNAEPEAVRARLTGGMP
jgi:hypothetical protein